MSNWLKKYNPIVFVFVTLFALGLACTPENPGNSTNTNTNTNTNDNTGKAPKLTVDWKFSPKVPVPNLPAQLDLGIKGEDGKAVKPGKVTLVATLADKKIEITLTANNENFAGKDIMFTADGEWELEATIEIDGTTQSIKQKLTIQCDNGGADGAACCKDTQCGNGLSCVYGSCGKDLNTGKNGCYEGNDCQSQVCNNNICLEGSCTDGSKNGIETDVDCGGACGACAAQKGCGKNEDCKSGSCLQSICSLPPGALIGTGDGSPDSVTWTVISQKGMNDPTALAFHPKKKNELWITNRIDDSFTVIFSASQDDQTQGTYRDLSQHFMEEIMSVTFDGEGYVGTCGDSTNTYGGLRAPNFFMGPATWSDDVNLLIRAGRSIHTTHLDMLHSSPNCMGIVAAGTHQFFAFNGASKSIDWYDFGKPHVPGGDDHSDGIKRRYSSPQVTFVKGVPSNLVYDKANKFVYIADTGSAQILRLDISKANQAGTITSRAEFSFPGDGILYRMTGDKTDVLVKFPGPLRSPSGLVKQGDILYVSDHKTGKLHAFDLDGKLIRSLDSGLGAGALSGIAINPTDNKLYLVDRKANRILRIDSK